MTQSEPATFAVVVATKDRLDAASTQARRLREMPDHPDEIILVDDGSAHPVAQGLRSLAESSGGALELVRSEGVGPASARNLGVRASGADWLIFLDDDDEPATTWMGAFRQAVSLHPEALFISFPSSTRLVGSHVAKPYEIRELGPAWGNITGSYRAGSFAVTRSAFDAVDGFMEGLYFMELTEFTLRLAESLSGQPDWAANGADPHLTIVSRPPTERGSVKPETLASSGRRALESVGHLLELDPALYANNLGSLAIAELRLGRVSAGRAHLWHAARISPWPPERLLRYLAAWVPPLRKRLWPLTHRS